jgi:hypothetical protein
MGGKAMKKATTRVTLQKLSRQGGWMGLLVAWVLLLSVPASANTIALSFDTLPSTQGWSYITNSGASETSVFSVSGGILHQNTLGLGEFAEYDLPGVVDPVLPFTLSVHARVLQEEGAMSNEFGFGFFVFTGTELFGIGLGTSSIQDALGTFLSTIIDNTQFHDYRLEGKPGVGYEFWVDNALIGSGAPRPYTQQPHGLSIGDLTVTTNARADVTRYSFSQSSTQIPEPNTFILLTTGLAGFLGYGGWRRRGLVA